MKKNTKTLNPLKALSWSAISCFAETDYFGKENPWGNKHKWYERYVLGMKEKPSKELIFGSMIDKRIQNDPEFLPDLERLPFMQYKLETVYKGIPLIGFADGWDPYELRLKDDKTGKVPWTQKKADETGQLTMYAAMIYLIEGIMPHEIRFQIDWMPTEEFGEDKALRLVEPVKVQTFKTQRSLKEVLIFLGYIEDVYAQMLDYVEKQN